MLYAVQIPETSDIMANTIPDYQNSQLFIFFSELLEEKIFDPDGNSVGKLLDLIVNIEGTYPHVTGVLLRLKNSRRIILLSSRDFSFTDGHFVARFTRGDFPAEKELVPSELMLKEALLDKQVVDIDGAKIRRVNDLQFLIANNDLYLVHVDVGFHGLLRRVGLKPLFGFILRALFDYEMSDQLVSWKFVQMISSPDLLRLTIAQNRLAHLHPADLADIIEDLNIHQRSAVFRSLDAETAAEILEETDPKIQVSLIQDMDTANASDIIEEMSLSEAADLLGDLPKDKAEGILREMEQDVADDVKELLAHPEEMAGGLMTTAFFSFAPERTVREAMETIRREAEDMDLIYYLYVLDSQDHILGVLSLRELIVAAPEKTLSELMDTRIVTVGIEERKGRIAEDFAKYGMLAMPVVDEDNRLKGVILFKNLLEVVLPKLGR